MPNLKKSQEDLILAHLQAGKSITPLEALKLFGCLRLSGRIFDLKRKGFQIEEVDVQDGNKRYAKYFLRPEHESITAQNNLAIERRVNLDKQVAWF